MQPQKQCPALKQGTRPTPQAAGWKQESDCGPAFMLLQFPYRCSCSLHRPASFSVRLVTVPSLVLPPHSAPTSLNPSTWLLTCLSPLGLMTPNPPPSSDWERLCPDSHSASQLGCRLVLSNVLPLLQLFLCGTRREAHGRSRCQASF